MDIDKEADCWSCEYSDFNLSNGKLVCTAEEGNRPDSCPLVNTEKVEIIETGVPPIKRRLVSGDSWQSKMVRPAGLEPATLGLEGRCSIQMSYGRR